MPRNDNFDVLIIGAGPAGLLACKELLENYGGALSVLLVERNRSYSDSIACGEGVWIEAFKKHLNLRPEWCRSVIKRAFITSPDKTALTLHCKDPDYGAIIDRVKMQEDLLSECASDQRVTLLRGVAVTELLVEKGRAIGANLSSGKSVHATYIIDASGPRSPFGYSMGLERHNKDLETACYALVTKLNIPEDAIELHRSERFGAGGYFWCFPGEEGRANIGIVTGASLPQAKNMKSLLKEAISLYYPTAEISYFRGGVIPNYTKRSRLTAPGYIQCGDAGGLVNPLTRSGISEAMRSGRLAAQFICMAMSGEKEKKALSLYEKELWRSYGKQMSRAARFKPYFYKIDSSVFNKAALELKDMPSDKLTMPIIMRSVVKHSLRLLISLKGVF